MLPPCRPPRTVTISFFLRPKPRSAVTAKALRAPSPWTPVSRKSRTSKSIAPFGHAAVVVGEAARGHDDGFGLVLHQVAEGVDGVHAVDGAVLVIAEFQGAVVETDVRRRIAQLLLHGHHVAHVGRAVLPPVEGVNGADADAEGVVVDGAFQLTTALIDEPSGGEVRRLLGSFRFRRPHALG